MRSTTERVSLEAGFPFLSQKGEVVGISNQQDRSAIPSNRVVLAYNQIIMAPNGATTGLVGILVRAVTPELAKRDDIPLGKGVVVQEVTPGSPADNAGIARGDLILEINRQLVNSEDDLNRMQASLTKGQNLVFFFVRQGEKMFASTKPSAGPRDSVTAGTQNWDQSGIRVPRLIGRQSDI